MRGLPPPDPAAGPRTLRSCKLVGRGGRASLSYPAGGWGAGPRGAAPPASHRFKKLLRGSERGRSCSPSKRTEPSRQVHGCGDSSGMTGWGYGQEDGRRTAPPAPTQLHSPGPARPGWIHEPTPVTHPVPALLQSPEPGPLCLASAPVPQRPAQSPRCAPEGPAASERPVDELVPPPPPKRSPRLPRSLTVTLPPHSRIPRRAPRVGVAGAAGGGCGGAWCAGVCAESERTVCERGPPGSWAPRGQGRSVLRSFPAEMPGLRCRLVREARGAWGRTHVFDYTEQGV